MFQVKLPCCLGLKSRQSVSINVNKTRKAFCQKQSFMARACFPNASQFPIPETLLTVSVFCFQHANYAYATQHGILTKIRACEHLPKFWEHEQAGTTTLRAIQAKAKFCEHFQIRWGHSIPLLFAMNYFAASSTVNTQTV